MQTLSSNLRTRTSKLHRTRTYVVGNDVRYSECAANLLGETQPSEVVLTIEYCERLKSFDESGGIPEKSVPRSFRPFHCTYRYDEACYQIREGGSNFPHALLSAGLIASHRIGRPVFSFYLCQRHEVNNGSVLCSVPPHIRGFRANLCTVCNICNIAADCTV